MGRMRIRAVAGLLAAGMLAGCGGGSNSDKIDDETYIKGARIALDMDTADKNGLLDMRREVCAAMKDDPSRGTYNALVSQIATNGRDAAQGVTFVGLAIKSGCPEFSEHIPG